MQLAKRSYTEVTDKLMQVGLRPTRQRILLGALLWSRGCRHVTAESLHSEAKQAEIKVSLATIYNTLHQFTSAGLLREIQIEGGRSYFDTNITSHHHFFHEDTGMLEDIPAGSVSVVGIPKPPYGTSIRDVDVIVRVRAS